MCTTATTCAIDCELYRPQQLGSSLWERGERSMAPRGSMACSLQLAVLMSAAIALGFGVRAGAAQLCSEYYDHTCTGSCGGC